MAVGEVGPGGHLLTAWNLADVPSPATARTNLGLVDANGVAVGGLVAQTWGPASATNYGSGTTTAFTLAVPLLAGNTYRVDLTCDQAQQITSNSSGPSQIYATDSGSLLHAPLSGVKAFLAANMTVNAYITGSGFDTITPVSSVTDTFTVSVAVATNSLAVIAFGIGLVVTRVA